MLKLNPPISSYLDMLTLCRNGITGNAGLLQNVNSASNVLQQQAEQYEASATTGELYTIVPLALARPKDDPVVVGHLKKSDLVKLYDIYVVGKSKPARAV